MEFGGSAVMGVGRGDGKPQYSKNLHLMADVNKLYHVLRVGVIDRGVGIGDNDCGGGGRGEGCGGGLGSVSHTFVNCHTKKRLLIDGRPLQA